MIFFSCMINCSSMNILFKNFINHSIEKLNEKVRFEYYECFWFKMFWMLISMPSCINNSSTISLWSLDAAIVSAVSLNVRVKYHKSFNFSIAWIKLDLNTMNVFDIKCLEYWYQCLLVLIIVQQFLYNH